MRMNSNRTPDPPPFPATAKVFELTLQETEREAQETGKEPEPSKCSIM